MQTLVIEGYLAADPSILSAQGSGRKRASFRLLETTRYRRADGEPGERTTGFNCVCFNEATAENYIAPYARKGSRGVIQGPVENDTGAGEDGGVHNDLRVVVEDMRLKNRRTSSSDGEDRMDGVAGDADHTGSGTAALDDDIPF
jgi:single-stranded DNA-binding protein